MNGAEFSNLVRPYLGPGISHSVGGGNRITLTFPERASQVSDFFTRLHGLVDTIEEADAIATDPAPTPAPQPPTTAGGDAE